MLARRDIRNSRSSARLSTSPTLRAVHGAWVLCRRDYHPSADTDCVEVQNDPSNRQSKGASHMTDKQVWLITGAGRGMGIDIAKAALAAGHAVVGTARNADKVTQAVGEHADLLAAPLDVTDPAAAESAVAAAVERFGHLDVLVNNAGSFYVGFFEEMTPEHFRAQIESSLFGPVNVTRAVLPQMRAQRAGLVV